MTKNEHYIINFEPETFQATDIEGMNEEYEKEIEKLRTLEKELCAATDIDEVKKLMVDSTNLMIKLSRMEYVIETVDNE